MNTEIGSISRKRERGKIKALAGKSGSVILCPT